jgi:hypothetical protein
MVRILPEASKIATHLFLIKISTSKGFVCLVTFLNLLTLDTCMISSILLCVISMEVHKMSLKTSQLIS